MNRNNSGCLYRPLVITVYWILNNLSYFFDHNSNVIDILVSETLFHRKKTRQFHLTSKTMQMCLATNVPSTSNMSHSVRTVGSFRRYTAE